MSHDEFEIHRLAGRQHRADAFDPDLDERIGHRLRRESRALAARYPGRPDAALTNTVQAESGMLKPLRGESMPSAAAALRRRLVPATVVVAGLLLLVTFVVLLRSNWQATPAGARVAQSNVQTAAPAGWQDLSKSKAPKHNATPPPAAADEPQEMLTLLVTIPDGQGGRKVIGTAYVPIRVEPFSLDRLSAAERYALERALAAEDGLHVASEI